MSELMGGDGSDAGVKAVLVDGVVEVRAETPDRRQTCQSHVHRPRSMLHAWWPVSWMLFEQ